MKEIKDAVARKQITTSLRVEIYDRFQKLRREKQYTFQDILVAGIEALEAK